MTEAEISSLRALLAAMQGLAATATELLNAAQGVPEDEPEPQPKRPRYLGADDPPVPTDRS